jgi:copper oxidase (laccase) domain-containing protein
VEQIHGNQIAVIDVAPNTEKEFQGCDALITNQPGILLGVHVADCCAVYIVDPEKRVVALAHSGKKGTELGSVSKVIDEVATRFGSSPRDLLVQLSPCIRPPHYEIDFAAEIMHQCQSRGVRQIYDDGICTACDLVRYYSYRAEKGRTGRMLALLGLK